MTIEEIRSMIKKIDNFVETLDDDSFFSLKCDIEVLSSHIKISHIMRAKALDEKQKTRAICFFFDEETGDELREEEENN